MKRLILLCLISLLNIHLRAQENELPYIYYYSRDDAAFFIERVDGADRQLLAEFEIDIGWERVIGPGWSPSGEWFAYTARDVRGSGGRQTAHVINRDGTTQQFEFAQEMLNVEMKWSPTRDQLLITWGDYPDNDLVCSNILVYDFESATALFVSDSSQIMVSHWCNWITHSQWSADGQYIFLSFQTHVAVLTPYGDVRLLEESNWQPSNLPMWIGQDQLVYVRNDAREIVIHSISSGQIETYSVPEGWIRSIDFDLLAEFSFAIIYNAENNESYHYDAWLLSRSENTVELFFEQIKFNPEDPRWRDIWLGNGKFLFNSVDDTLHVLDPISGHVTDVLMPQNTKFSSFPTFRWVAPDLVLFPVSHRALYESYVAYYNLTTDTATLVPHSKGGYFSDVRGNLFMDEIDSLLDLSGNITALQIIGEDDNLFTSLEEVRWHPTLNYLFAFTEGAPYIVDVEQQTRRLLPNCISRQASCIGWLPES